MWRRPVPWFVVAALTLSSAFAEAFVYFLPDR